MTHLEESIAAEQRGRPPQSTGAQVSGLWSWWFRIPVLSRVALGMIAVQLLLRGWVVGGSYYFQDDFLHLRLARSLGLDRDYLVRDYGGHLETGQYFLMWLLSHVMDDSFVAPTVSILVLQAMASWLIFYLLRTLFGESPALLVPLAVYLFTPLGLSWSAWWSAALQTLPLQIFTMVAILGMVKVHRAGSVRWAVVSVLAHVLGLVFWEKAAFILPTLLAVQVLVLSTGGLRERARDLVKGWRTWLVHAAVLAGYLFLYTSVVESVLSEESVDREVLVTQSVFRMFIPGLFGGPWHADGAEHTIYPAASTFEASLFLGALIAVVVLSLAVTGRSALLGWFLIVGYVTADLTLLGLGRADWLGLLARDPRYVADALPVVAIAVAAAFRGLVEGSPRPAALWLAPRLHLAGALKVVALLLLSSYVTTRSLAPVVQHEYPKNFVQGVVTQLEAKPDQSLLNGPVPSIIAARVDLGGLLEALNVDVKLDRPAHQMYLVDSLANVRPMALFPGSSVETGPEAGCGWSLEEEPTVVGALPEGNGSTRALQVRYTSPVESVLTIQHGDDLHSFDVTAGTSDVFFPLGQEAGDLLASMDGGVGLCMREWSAGPGSQPGLQTLRALH